MRPMIPRYDNSIEMEAADKDLYLPISARKIGWSRNRGNTLDMRGFLEYHQPLNQVQESRLLLPDAPSRVKG